MIKNAQSTLFFLTIFFCNMSLSAMTTEFHRLKTCVKHSDYKISKKIIEEAYKQLVRDSNLRCFRIPRGRGNHWEDISKKIVDDKEVILSVEYMYTWDKSLLWVIYYNPLEDAVNDHNAPVDVYNNIIEVETNNIFPAVLAKIICEYAKRPHIEVIE